MDKPGWKPIYDGMGNLRGVEKIGTYVQNKKAGNETPFTQEMIFKRDDGQIVHNKYGARYSGKKGRIVLGEQTKFNEAGYKTEYTRYGTNRGRQEIRHHICYVLFVHRLF